MDYLKIQWSASMPQDAKLILETTLFHNCYICLVSGSAEIFIRQQHVAELCSQQYVARIKVSSIKPLK